MISIFCKGAG